MDMNIQGCKAVAGELVDRYGYVERSALRACLFLGHTRVLDLADKADLIGGDTQQRATRLQYWLSATYHNENHAHIEPSGLMTTPACVLDRGILCPAFRTMWPLIPVNKR